jgi:hypothetical protein
MDTFHLPTQEPLTKVMFQNVETLVINNATLSLHILLIHGLKKERRILADDKP